MNLVITYSINFIKICIESLQLLSASKQEVNPRNLRSLNENEINDILVNEELGALWNANEEKIKKLSIGNLSGGLNKGDRKALFYLVSFFKPSKILEVGTHIGFSTLFMHMATMSYKHKASSIKTVDILDVNDNETKNWEKYGSMFSPESLLKIVDDNHNVEFINSDSISFLKNTNEKFDFIFLDGGHNGLQVYNELSFCFDRLNQNGIILLHDYFHDNKPIWNNGKVIPGPYLAVRKLKKISKKVKILRLIELPWETKLGSKFSSLALIVR